MAVFSRKNKPIERDELLLDVANRTLDWSRAVRVPDMELAYVRSGSGVFTEGSGERAKYGNRYRLLVPGSIFAHQKTAGDTDVSIIICNANADRLYTAAGTMAESAQFTGLITPIINTGTYVVATKSSTGSNADIKNFYMVFVPTLGSAGVTDLANFLVYVDKIAPLDKTMYKYPVPNDLLL